MRIRKYLDKLQQRQAESIFLSAQKHFVMKPGTASFKVRLAQAVAVLVLLTPVMVAILAIWLAIALYPSFGSVLFGGLFMALAIALLPRVRKPPTKLYTARDFPALFALLNAIAEKIGTRAPDSVALTAHLNASATEYGFRHSQRVLEIGIPLWIGMTNQEKIALLAHELAHFVNGDPARGTVLDLAFQTLSRWGYYLAPDEYEPALSLPDLILGVFRLPFSGLTATLLGLHFRASQQAEYLADAVAARVSGSAAMGSALRRLMITGLADKAVDSLYPYRTDQGRRIFDVMGASLGDLESPDAKDLIAKAEAEKARVDLTHPPSVYRLAFLEALGESEPAILERHFDFKSIESAFAPEADRLGKKLMQSLEVQ